MPSIAEEAKAALADLDRAIANHPDATIQNDVHLRNLPHAHAAAMCRSLAAILREFGDCKVFVVVEAEISALEKRARPEDLVIWIEGVGVFVIEVKSHRADGIRSFENGVPQVVYGGVAEADTDLVKQPEEFAYNLSGHVSKACDRAEVGTPALYFAGWLPNVSPEQVARLGAEVPEGKVWLSDMLRSEVFRARLDRMKNLTRGSGAPRETLEPFSSIFGCTSGLRVERRARSVQIGSLGHRIDQRVTKLKKLTTEQEQLAFAPALLRGPKVIRGVAGSGKTVVLANAVAEVFLKDTTRRANALFPDNADGLHVLVLCFNRALAPYLRRQIRKCFDDRKSRGEWQFPDSHLELKNIDRYAYALDTGRPHRDQVVAKGRFEPVEIRVNRIRDNGCPHAGRFSHIFIDEGQDLELEWYPLIREVARNETDEGASIIVFYDDAQNLYGIRRPGTSGAPAWKDLLGAVPNPMGLKTVMRVGHRNTNEILSFSFSLLLGGFAATDPKMAVFADLAQYEGETIPDDPKLNHPHAGRPCVEKLGERRYKVNFSVETGPVPQVHRSPDSDRVVADLAKEIARQIQTEPCNVQPHDILIMAPDQADVAKVALALHSIGLAFHCPVKMNPELLKRYPILRRHDEGDPRDEEFFQVGRVTVSTIRSAKGFSAPVCHVALIDSLVQPDSEQAILADKQQARAQLHVACTRALYWLEVWSPPCALLDEAEEAANSMRTRGAYG